MKKWLITGACVLLLVFMAYVGAGPYLAMNGIRNVTASGDVGKLAYFVDFPKLRESVTPQIQDRMTRDIRRRLGPGSTADVASGAASVISEPVINAMVSPLGVGALLSGNSLARRFTGRTDPDGQVQAIDPLKDARTRYVSASRFTATVTTFDGKPLVFVFERDGLTWKLTGLELPD